MVCTVKPKPAGPRRMMMGGFRLLTNGESSLQGEVSLELAVLEPPGDCRTCCGISSATTTKYLNQSLQFYVIQFRLKQIITNYNKEETVHSYRSFYKYWFLYNLGIVDTPFLQVYLSSTFLTVLNITVFRSQDTFSS